MEGNLGDGRLRTPAITVKKLPLIKIIKNCTVHAKHVYCKYPAELVLPSYPSSSLMGLVGFMWGWPPTTHCITLESGIADFRDDSDREGIRVVSFHLMTL